MHLKNSKIIVIKIGSSLLVDDERKIRKKWLSSFAKDIKKLKSKNRKIIKDFSKNTKSEVITLSTLSKKSISQIKAKLISYAS